MKRKICVVTGTRAEYGLLKGVMGGINNHPSLQLQLLVTGAHLSPEHGSTYLEIESDGFNIDAPVEMLLSADSGSGIAKSMGLGLIGFADAFKLLAPDLVVVLGDRYEILAAVSAALVSRIPIAHLHGGEVTEGAFDEGIRHAITKMAHLHFVAAPEYQNRVLQLGEAATRVHCVGGLGADAIKRTTLIDRLPLEASLGLKFGIRNLLITFHPVTLDPGAAEQQVDELLAALEPLVDTQLIFTMPNADNESRLIVEKIRIFCSSRSNAHCFTSLGLTRYLSCVAQVDGVVGNSSSGIAEVPTLRKGTVNIGNRQKGRLMATSVINCPPQRDDISRSISRLYDPEFKRIVEKSVNPYGDGGASARIVSILASCDLQHLLRKKFNDLQYTPLNPN